MFHIYRVDENPAIIPLITTHMNTICDQEILSMIRKLANDKGLDYNKLSRIYTDNPIQFKLAGNIHYPPPQENRCKARIRGKGYGKTQCKRKIFEEHYCKRHYKQLLECKTVQCNRGIQGLGACSDHKGLRLGRIDKEIPVYNNAGKKVIRWRKQCLYKKKNIPKIRKKLHKIKFIIKSKSPPSTELTEDYLQKNMITLMNSVDLNDSSITNPVLIKRLELIVQHNLSEYKKYLNSVISNHYKILLEEELEDSNECNQVILEEDLVKYWFDDKPYYLHKHTNEVFNYNSSSKRTPIGMMQSTDCVVTLELF